MQPVNSPLTEQDSGIELILALFKDGRLEDAALDPLDPVVGCEFQLSRAVFVSQDPSDKKRLVYAARPVLFAGSVELTKEDWEFILRHLADCCFERQWTLNDLRSKYVNLHTYLNIRRSGQPVSALDLFASIGMTEGPHPVSCVACNGLLRGHVKDNYYLSWPDELEYREGWKVPRGAAHLPQHLVKWLNHSSTFQDLMVEARAPNHYFHPRMVFGHPHLHYYDPTARILVEEDGALQTHTLVDSIAHCYLHAALTKEPRRTPGYVNLPVSKWLRDVTPDARWKVWISYLILCFGLKFLGTPTVEDAWLLYERMEGFHDLLYEHMYKDEFLVTERVHKRWIRDQHVLLTRFRCIIIEGF